ncbi:MAG: class I SAM-dependent methyltransferase [Desulfarculus sp.]|nr:class I SAM-dependent methyltransferase [Desulfarculus sp.]
MHRLESKLWESGLLAGYQRAAGGVWQPERLALSQTVQPHCATEGVSLDERSQVEMSTSFYEWQIYKAFLGQNLGGMAPGLPLLELGAGDGRITRFVLQMGFEQVIACDCNLGALRRLRSKLGPEERDRVVLIQNDIGQLSFPPGYFGAVIAIEVLYYLNEGYEGMLERLHQILAPQGLLMHSEPLLEGALTYALVAQDWDSVRSLCHERLKIEDIGQGQIARSRVFTLTELQAAGRGAGFAWRDLRFTPALNSVAVKQIGAAALEPEAKLELLRGVRQLLDSGQNPRCALVAAGKAQVD